MNTEALVLAVALSFAAGSGGAYLIHRFGSRIGLIDIPNARSSHVQPTPRGGGIGIWVSLMLVAFFFLREGSLGLLAGAVGLVGLLEDRFSLSARLRFSMHLLLAVIVTALVREFPSSTTGAVLFVFWAVFITGTANFYNFMDGINGIAGLTGFVGFGLLGFFSIAVVHEPRIALMSAALAAGCLGFLPFNVPRARVFMGDVGSILLGFFFAAFVVQLSVSVETFLCSVMFLCTFFSDALITIYCRWRRGENLAKAHRSHLYQYLSNELRVPHWKVSVLYALVQLVFGILSIVAFRQGLLWQVSVFSAFSVLSLSVYGLVMRIPRRNEGMSEGV